MEAFLEILPYIIPFILINVAIQVYVIIDIHKADRKVILMNKTWWTVFVILLSVGWVIYLLAGREQ